MYILIPHIITAGRLLYKHIWHCPQIQYIVTIYKIIKQLKNFDYEAYMTTYSKKCVFSFEGKYIYMKDCK